MADRIQVKMDALREVKEASPGTRRGGKSTNPGEFVNVMVRAQGYHYNIASTFSMEYEVTRGPVDELFRKLRVTKGITKLCLSKGLT